MSNKEDPNEMTPTVCGDTMQNAFNSYDRVSPNTIARGLRGLCRWLSRAYQCFRDRQDKIEENVAVMKTRISKLEGWMNGEESGSRSHTKALADLVYTGQTRRRALSARVEVAEEKIVQLEARLEIVAGNGDHHIHPAGPYAKPAGPFAPTTGQREQSKTMGAGNARIEDLDEKLTHLVEHVLRLEETTPDNARIQLLQAKIEILERQLQGHIRGDVKMWAGTLTGPGPLFHEKHPHKPIAITQEQSERLIKGKSTHEEILKEIEQTEKARASMEGMLNTLERARPRHCAQCGAKL